MATIKGIKAGTTTINVSYTDGGVTKSTSISDFQVNKVAGYLTATTTDRTYNGASQVVGTISTNSGNYYFGFGSSTTSAPSSWEDANTSLSATTAGTYYVWAKCDSSTNYNAVGAKYIGKVTISKASTNAPVLTAGGTTTYTGSTYYATAKNGSGNPAGKIYYGSSSGSTSYNITASSTASNLSSMGRSDVGTTTIYAFFRPTDTTNYADSSSASTTVTITNKATGSGSVTMSGWTYGGTVTNPTPSSSTNGTSNVSYTWYNSSKTALSSKPGSTSTAGTYYVKATFAATTNYTAYTTDYVSFTISKASQSAPTAKGASSTYSSSGSISGSASGGGGQGTLYYKVDTSGGTSYGSATTTAPSRNRNSVGTTTFVAYWGGDSNYNASPNSSQASLFIDKASQSAPTATGASVIYPSTATASYSGGGGVGTLTWTNGSSRSAIGSQTTKAYWSGNGNYYASGYSNEVTLSVSKYTPTVSLSATDRVYNGNALYATATVSVPSGGKTMKGTIYYGTSSGSTSYSVSYSGSAVSLSSVSVTNYNNGSGNSVTVYAYFVPDSTCNDVYNSSGNASKTMTITGKASQSAPTATGASSQYATSGSISGSASGGGGQGTLYYKADANGGTSYGTAATSVSRSKSSLGTTTFVAYWGGNSNYNASPNSSQASLTVVKADQSAPTATGSSVTYPSTATASASGGGGQGSIEWSNGSSRSAIGSQTTKARWSGNTYYNASGYSSEVTLSVAKYTPTVTLSATDRIYNGNALYASATVSVPSGGKTMKGTIYYGTSSGSTSYSVAYSGSAVSLSSVSVTNYNGGSGNSVTVYAYFVPDSTCNDVYNSSGNASKKMTITGKANQSAPTATGATVTYPSEAKATSTGGGGVGTLTWTNGNTQSGAGSKTTKAYWSGNGNYNASGYSNEVTLKVNKAAGSTGVSTSAMSITYSTTSATRTVSGNTNTVSVSSSNENIATVSISGSTITVNRIGYGSATITASVAAATNYEAATSSFTVTNYKAAGSVKTAPANNGATYGSESYLCTTGASDTGTMYYRLGTSGSYSTTRPTTSGLNVGSYTLYYYAAESTNYYATSATSITVTVVQANGSVAGTVTNRTYNTSGQTVGTLTSATGDYYLGFGSSTSSGPSSWGTKNVNTISATTAGTYYVWAKCDASTNYKAVGATYIGTAKIEKASTNAPVLTAGGTSTYTGSTYYATAKNGSGNPAGTIYYGSSSGATTYSLTASSTATNMSSMGRSNVGTTTIYAFFRPTDTSNYKDSPVASTTVTITYQATGTVKTAPTNNNSVYGSGSYLCTTGASDTGTMYYRLGTSGNYSTTRPTTSGLNAGTYTVYYYSSSTTNYTQSDVGSVTVTVAQATGTVKTAPTNNNSVYGSGSYLCTTGASDTGTMYYRLGTSGNYSTTRPTTSGLNAGTYTVYYYSSSTTNYTQSTTGSVEVTVAKQSRSGAVSCNDVTYGSTVQASVSGNTEGGTVTWGITNGTGKATINSSGVVTPTQVGTVTVTASVAATTNYLAYTATSKGITISSKAIVIPAPTGYSAQYDGNSHTGTFPATTGATITKWRYSTDNSTWTETTSANPSQTNVGTLYVQAYYSANANYTGSGWSGSATITVSRSRTATASAITGLVYNGTTESNGTAQTGVSGSNVSWSGTTSAINAGSYAPTATPTSNYAWSDGTYAAKTISWSIARRGQTAPVLNGATSTYPTSASASVKTAGTVSNGTATAPGTLTWSNRTRSTAGTQTATAYYAATTTNFSASAVSNGVAVTVNKGTPTTSLVTDTTTYPTTANVTFYSNVAGTVYETYNGTALTSSNYSTAYQKKGTVTAGNGSSTNGCVVDSGSTANTWTIYVYFVPNDGSYNAVALGPKTLKVNPATISIPTPTGVSKTYDRSASSVTFPATTGATITKWAYSTDNSNWTETTSSNPSQTNVGTLYVKAYYTANTNYTGSGWSVSKAIVISQKEVTLTWGTVSWTYDGNAHSTTCTLGGVINGDTCTLTLSGNSITNPGSTTVSTSLSNSNYKLPSTSTKSISVSKYTPTVTLSATNRIYNGNPLYATATVSKPTNGKAITGTIYYGTTSGATTYSTTYSSGVGLNSVSVTNYNGGSGNSATVYAYFVPDSSCNAYYNNSGNASKTMTITGKAAGTGSVTMSGWIYGNTASNPSPSSSTNGTSSVTYTWYDSNKSSLSAKPGSTSAVGTYYVKATFAATGNYNAVTTDFVSFKITQREVTLNWGTSTWTYDGNSHTVTCTAGNVVSGDTCTVTLSGQSRTAAGTQTVTATGLSNSNYKLPSSTTATLTINAATISVVTTGKTSVVNQSYTYNGSAQGVGLTATTKGSQTATIRYRTASSGDYTLESAPQATNVADSKTIYYKVTAPNHNDVTGSYTLSITNKSISIPTPTSVSKTYAKTAYSISFSSTTGATITNYRYSTDNSNWTTSSSNPTLTNVGKIYVQAYYTASTNYTGSGWSSSATITISEKTVSLTWGTTSWTYNGSAHSTTCVLGGIESGDTCNVTLTGNSITNVGTTTVTASALSNSNYKLPASNTATLTINAATITVVTSGKTSVVNQSYTYNGSAQGVGLTATTVANQTAAIKYGTTSGSYTSTTVPTITNVSDSKTIYYQVTAPNHSTKTGSYTLTITKKSVTVTAGSSSRAFNYSALTNANATVSGLASSNHHLHSWNCIGSQTYVGSSDNIVSDATIYSGTHNGTESDVTSNYNISYTKGTLTVTKATPSVSISGVDETYTGGQFYAKITSINAKGTLYWKKGSAPTTSSYDGTTSVTTTGTPLATAINITSVKDNSDDFVMYWLFVPSSSSTITSGQTYAANFNNAGGGSSDNKNLVINPRSIANVTASADTVTYTGSERTASVSVADSGATLTSNDYTISGNKQTYAGTYTITITGKNNYTGSKTISWTINKKSVTITAGSASKVYDGSALTKSDGATSNIDLNTLGDHIHSYTSTGSQTNVGSSNNTLSEIKIYKGSHGGTETDVTSSYNITAKTGTLTVSNAEITVSAPNQSYVYDGLSHGNAISATTKGSQTATIKYGTKSGTYDLTSAPKITNVADSKTIYYQVTAPNHTSKSGSYELTITKPTLSVTANNQSKVYTGTALSANNECTLSGTLPTNHTISYSCTGSQTNVGSSTKTLSSVVIKNGSGTDVTANFTVNKTNGTLTVTNATMTVSAPNQEYTYNGSAQGSAITVTTVNNQTATIKYGTVSGTYDLTSAPKITNVADSKTIYYKVTAPNHSEKTGSYSLSIKKATGYLTATTTDRTYNGASQVVGTILTNSGNYYFGFGSSSTTAPSSWGSVNTSISATNAGDYYVWVKCDSSANYNAVSAKFVKKATISKKSVTVTASSSSKVYTGTTLTSNTATLKNQVSGHTLNTVTVTGSQTNVGSSSNVPSGAKIYSGSTDVTNNYDITYVNGTLTVTNATITVSAPNQSYTYNGSAQGSAITVTTVNSQTATIKYGTTSGTYNLTSAPKITNVADSKTIYYNVTAPNHSEKTGSYELTITEKSITIPTPTGVSKVYDGTSSSVSFPAATGATITGYQYSTDNSTWTNSDTNPSRTNVSTTYVRAYYTANTNYKGSGWSASKTIVISNATMTVSAPNQEYMYNGSAKGVGISVTTVNSQTATIKYGTTSGTYDLTSAPKITNVADSKTIYYQVTAPNHTSKSGSYTLNITSRAITFKANDQSKTYDGSALSADNTATRSGGNELVSGHKATFTCTGSQTVVGSSDKTLSTVVIKDSGNNDVSANYTITKVKGTLTVTKRTVSITAPSYNSNTLTYNKNSQTIASGASCTAGGVMYYYTSTSSTKPTWNGGTGWSSTSTAINANTYYAWYYCLVSDTDNNTGSGINTVTEISGSKAIYKKEVTLTWGTTSFTYDGTEKTVTCSLGGVISGDSCSLTLTGNKQTNAGTYTATASSLSNANYKLPSSNTKSYTIGKANLVIEEVNYNAPYDGKSHSSTIKVTNSDWTGKTIVSGSTTSYGTTVTSSGVGDYAYALKSATNYTPLTTIYYKITGDNNYNDYADSVTFQISKANRSGAVSCSDVTYGSNVNATVSGNTENGTVTWSITNGTGTATINSSGKVTPTSVGKVTVKATVAETTNYAAYTATSKEITILQLEAILSWGTTTWVYDGDTHSTTCTVTNVVSGDTCTVILSGNSITNIGSTTVTATGLSNGNYKLPSSKTKTLTVSPGMFIKLNGLWKPVKKVYKKISGSWKLQSFRDTFSTDKKYVKK